jgi:RHS repeat-associated protein
VTNLQGDVIGIINDPGTRVVTYTYDAWGNPQSLTGSLANTIGELNPFRYRSYYYDAETKFYYLNDRYYDPTTGRFINSDGCTTTGQGTLGNNAYSYCLNNPINRLDSSGKKSDLYQEAHVIAANKGNTYSATDVAAAKYYLRYGTSRNTDVGAAQPYLKLPEGGTRDTARNCYTYALYPLGGRSPYDLGSSQNPGFTNPNNPVTGNQVTSVGAAVEYDVRSMGFTIRVIDGPNGEINENEYRIALRVGTEPFYSEGGIDYYDYHFMVQTYTGQWAEKHGPGGPSILWDPSMTPDTIPWDLYKNDSYYDSDIIYYAIGR